MAPPDPTCSIAANPQPLRNEEPTARIVAHNVRRLMAQEGMTYEDLVAATSLDARTIRGVVRGQQTPQARTLHRLADGFGVSTNELFTPPGGFSEAAFDAATNPVVSGLKTDYPDLFEGWSAKEFSELASRFGVGGELTESGAVEEARKMNARREVLRRARVVLETPHAGLLIEFVDLLYGRVQITE